MIAHVRSYAYFMETKPHCVLLKMTNHFFRSAGVSATDSGNGQQRNESPAVVAVIRVSQPTTGSVSTHIRRLSANVASNSHSDYFPDQTGLLPPLNSLSPPSIHHSPFIIYHLSFHLAAILQYQQSPICVDRLDLFIICIDSVQQVSMH